MLRWTLPLLLVACDVAVDAPGSLATLDCAPGETPVRSAEVWACAAPTAPAPPVDTDAPPAAGLDADDVAAIVDAEGFAKADDLAAIATTGAWTDLVGVPADLADGDADTLASLPCGNGAVAVSNGVGGWRCQALPGGAGVVAIAGGGTGATSADEARANLGAAAATHDHAIGDLSGVLPSGKLSGSYTSAVSFGQVTALTATAATVSGTLTLGTATVSGGRFGTATLTAPTISSPAVTGGTFSGGTHTDGTFTGGDFDGGTFTDGAFSGDGSGLTGLGAFAVVVPDRGCGVTPSGTVQCRTNPGTPLVTCPDANTCPLGACNATCVPPSTTTPLAWDVHPVVAPGDGRLRVTYGSSTLVCRNSESLRYQVELVLKPRTGSAVLLTSVVAERTLLVPGADHVVVGHPTLIGTAAVSAGQTYDVRVRLKPEVTSDACWLGGLAMDGSGVPQATLQIEWLPMTAGL